MKTFLPVAGLLCAISLTVSGTTSAQTKPPAPAASAGQASATPAPKPLVGSIQSRESWPAPKNMADVDTIDHIIASLYDVISGPAGKARDWDRFRSLFLPDGRLAPIRPDVPATADRPARKADAVIFSPDVYVERQDGAFKANGFFERSVANRVEEFGNLAQVWSTYESRRTEADAAPFARGINSIQLVHAQGRYWIASIMWDAERPGLTLPDKYLK